jgi:hypothetical protein
VEKNPLVIVIEEVVILDAERNIPDRFEKFSSTTRIEDANKNVVLILFPIRLVTYSVPTVRYDP